MENRFLFRGRNATFFLFLTFSFSHQSSPFHLHSSSFLSLFMQKTKQRKTDLHDMLLILISQTWSLLMRWEVWMDNSWEYQQEGRAFSRIISMKQWISHRERIRKNKIYWEGILCNIFHDLIIENPYHIFSVVGYYILALHKRKWKYV